MLFKQVFYSMIFMHCYYLVSNTLSVNIQMLFYGTLNLELILAPLINGGDQKNSGYVQYVSVSFSLFS